VASLDRFRKTGASNCSCAVVRVACTFDHTAHGTSCEGEKDEDCLHDGRIDVKKQRLSVIVIEPGLTQTSDFEGADGCSLSILGRERIHAILISYDTCKRAESSTIERALKI
jgi:hypothetical protein